MFLFLLFDVFDSAYKNGFAVAVSAFFVSSFIEKLSFPKGIFFFNVLADNSKNYLISSPGTRLFTT